MDRDEMSSFNRGPSIDASYQVSVRLAKRFQRRRFLKIGQSKIRISNASNRTWTFSHSHNKCIIFTSPCQRKRELLPSLGVRRPLTFHILAQQFQRRRFLESDQSKTRIACGSHVY
jgi:hypothetical protein